MREDRLPFNIEESKTLTSSGKESDIEHMIVKDKTDASREMVLKENRTVELSGDIEMQKLKRFYEFMKNDPDFGKFVVDTHFIKAQRNADEPAKAFLVQKFIPGKRIDKMTNEEIYRNKALTAELLEFAKASVAMLEKTAVNPEYTPDFYADKENFLGNFLHNPRYSGNILVADESQNLPHRVYFVDSGTLFGPGHDQGFMKRLRRPLDNKLQLLQLKRWITKLEQVT